MAGEVKMLQSLDEDVGQYVIKGAVDVEKRNSQVPTGIKGSEYISVKYGDIIQAGFVLPESKLEGG
jgi:hypothetical protein